MLVLLKFLFLFLTSLSMISQVLMATVMLVVCTPIMVVVITCLVEMMYVSTLLQLLVLFHAIMWSFIN